MRTIKFRGKRLDGQGWAIGHLVKRAFSDHDEYFIVDDVVMYHHPVDPATVGQYTGLIDKDGKEIFEGDILKGTSYLYGYQLQPDGQQFDFEGFVEWEEQCDVGLQWMLTDLEQKGSWWLRQTVHRNTPDFSTGEIISNIHDNPELLKNNKDRESSSKHD